MFAIADQPHSYAQTMPKLKFDRSKFRHFPGRIFAHFQVVVINAVGLRLNRYNRPRRKQR
jgi:hypothetical protein